MAIEVNNKLMDAYALGSSGTGQPFLKDNPYYGSGDTIFSAQQAFDDSQGVCMTGCASNTVTKTYNTANWPGACGRDVVSPLLDGPALPDVGLLKLTYGWRTVHVFIEQDYSALKVAFKYLDEAFKQSTRDSWRPLRMQGHWNKGNCALTDGPAAAISGNKDEKYNKQVIPQYLAASIYSKDTQKPWNTLYFSADICNPQQQGNPICEYLDKAMEQAQGFPGYVTGASSILCRALNPDMKPQIEKCPDGF